MTSIMCYVTDGSNNAELPEQLLDVLHPEFNVNIF